jgi:hypothetical protein
MITGGPTCGLLANSRELQTNNCPCSSENLTLAIVGIEPSVIVCDDFYGALAKNTGQ